MSTAIPIVAFPLLLSEGQAHKLQLDHEPNLVMQDPERFEPLDSGADVEDFAQDTTLIWCNGTLASLIVLSYERSVDFVQRSCWTWTRRMPTSITSSCPRAGSTRRTGGRWRTVL